MDTDAATAAPMAPCAGTSASASTVARVKEQIRETAKRRLWPAASRKSPQFAEIRFTRFPAARIRKMGAISRYSGPNGRAIHECGDSARNRYAATPYTK